VHCALQWVSVWRGHNIAIVLRVCASRTKRGFKRASCARIDIPYDNMQHATRSLSETMVIVLDVKTTAEVLMVSTTRDSPSQIQCMREKPGIAECALYFPSKLLVVYSSMFPYVRIARVLILQLTSRFMRPGPAISPQVIRQVRHRWHIWHVNTTIQ
jgi:hypothetical protein